MKPSIVFKSICLFSILALMSNSLSASQLYWIGGPGNWTNTAKWSLTSGGAAATVLPDENTNVVFDTNSGLLTGDNVNIPGGDHSVEDFIVTGFPANFKFRFIGASNDPTIMNVHGNLRLLSTHSIVYIGTGAHKWIFHGKDNGSQEIKSHGKNLHYVEFPNDNKDYHLNGDLVAVDWVFYKGGNLTTNDFDIFTEKFLVENNGSIADSQKNFIVGNSTIACDDYSDGFCYGALDITGNLTIRTKKFTGQATQNGFTSSYPKIILKDYDLGTDFFAFNLRCIDCLIDTLIVENTFDSRFSGKFVIEDILEIQSIGTAIAFSDITNSTALEITINGQVITPAVSGCEQRTTFKVYAEDFATFLRSNGTLTISDANIHNIQTGGTASFVADNSILLETSSGWTVSNSPAAQTYHWIGNSGVDQDWDNPDNWELANGTSNGCIPIAVDNVVIDDSALNSVRIPNGTVAACNDFSLTKTTPTTLLLDGTFTDDTQLYIKGDLFLHSSATVAVNGLYDIFLDASTNNFVETNSVSLPAITFTGSGGHWKLLSNFVSTSLNLASGTLTTLDYNIETNKFSLLEVHPKYLNLGASHIKVNGSFDLKPFGVEGGVYVNAGTSFIECEELDFQTVSLYDIQLNNTLDDDIGNTQPNPNFADDFLTAHRLILNGTGTVTSKADLNIDSLIFMQDDAILMVVPGEILMINEAIVSETSSANPASIVSSESGMQAPLEKPIGNLCVSGYVNFQDMNADMDGAFHAPLGADLGNNTSINFSNSTILTPLYWIGNTGDWDTKSNWSNVSGGCPVSKDPNTAFQLIFDDYSFISPSDIISLPNLTNCKTLNFSNTLYPANIDIQTRLNPLQIFINDANVNFAGAKMYVQVKTVLNGEANLTLDITEGDTPKYDTPILELYDNSNMIVKSNTLLIVRE